MDSLTIALRASGHDLFSVLDVHLMTHQYVFARRQLRNIIWIMERRHRQQSNMGGVLTRPPPRGLHLGNGPSNFHVEDVDREVVFFVWLLIALLHALASETHVWSFYSSTGPAKSWVKILWGI